MIKKDQCVAVICPHPAEMKAAASVLTQARRWKGSLVSGYLGRMGSTPCIVVGSGMGADRAYVAVKQIIPLHDPGLVIDFGAAAGVSERMTPGTVALVRGAVDYSAVIARWKEKDPFEENPSALEDPGPEAHVSSIIPEGLMEGWAMDTALAACADYFLKSPELRSVLESRNMDLFDFETWAVFRSARESGIKCLGIRGVTDRGDHAAARDFRTYRTRALEAASKRLRDLVSGFSTP